MTFLVIGLGSMGKRRIRCLNALGYEKIYGFDLRKDRREEAVQKYNIIAYSSLDEVPMKEISAFIISTPPDIHTKYAKIAIDNNKPAFIEASVILEEVQELKNYNKKNIFIAPSCTTVYHPVIQDIKEIVLSGKYGKVTNFTFHCGQYLPDWHSYEDVKDFYVSKRETGGGREIVPFELTWMTDIFGFPNEIKGYFSATMDVGAKIEDTYAFTMRFENRFIGSVIVDVAARFATRTLILNLEQAQLRWNWEEKILKVYEAITERWIHLYQPEGKSVQGYNQNINENIYVNEVRAFIEGTKEPSRYPNTIDKDIKILELLNKIEISDGGF